MAHVEIFACLQLFVAISKIPYFRKRHLSRLFLFGLASGHQFGKVVVSRVERNPLRVFWRSALVIIIETAEEIFGVSGPGPFLFLFLGLHPGCIRDGGT